MSHVLWAAFLVAGAAPADSAGAFVDRWHAELRGDRREAVLELMASDAAVFEAGQAENSRDEYAQQHLDADMSFARTTTTTVEKRRIIEMEGSAMVLSQTATSGTFEGQPVSSRGVETMVLRRADGGWRIAHIHWSSRRLPPRISPSPPASRPTPVEPSPAGDTAPAAAPSVLSSAAPREHLSARRLASQLRSAGLKVEGKGTLRQPFFAVPAQVMTVGEDEIEVFEFPSAPDADKAAASVSADGGTIGTSAVHWMAPPHVHRRGRTIVIHLGSGAQVRSALERIVGAPFAGRP